MKQSPIVQATVNSFDPTLRQDPETKVLTPAFIVHCNAGEFGLVGIYIGCTVKQLSSGLTADSLRAFGFDSIEAAATNPDAAVGKLVAIRWVESELSEAGGSWKPVTAKRADASAFLAALKG